ncbi:MAG: twin-arginine translocation signal domain-containing protein [Lysobacteraceae bacterium]|jgi:Rieske Fe-S protein
MRRRDFVATCTAGACALALGGGCSSASGPLVPQRFGRVRLVDGDGAPVRASTLAVGESLVFHYPYVSTPAFVFRLAAPVEPEAELRDRDGRSYRAQPGVGPGRSIVGFCAICVHQLSHPSPQLTYISLRERLPGEAGIAPHVISCCAQNSRFDPYQGARVIDGPADQPLASILLEHDPAEDSLHATGLIGGVVFQRFFETFARRLHMEHGGADGPARLARGDVRLHRLRDYSGNILSC